MLCLVGQVGDVREVGGWEDGPEGYPACPLCPGRRDEQGADLGVDAVCAEDDVCCCCGAVGEG